MKKNISILGVGWLGTPLAKQLKENNHVINGSVRFKNELEKLAANHNNINVISIEVDQILGNWDDFLAETTHLIIMFPPNSRKDIEQTYKLQMLQITKRTSPSLKVIFISSTAVYPNLNQTVTEQNTPAPSTANGKSIYAAEQVLSAHFKTNLTIVRLAGLIGSDRHPTLFLKEKRVLKSPDVPVNVIHQEDAVQLITKVITNNLFGEIINGCAEKHPIRKDLYTEAAYLLDLPAPIFNKQRTSSYKIVDSSKSKCLLSFDYKYPDPQVFFNKGVETVK
ncbi:NAD-dependent epimerase/dehydratase family protein [Flammeovirga kamogawensis]|uniref:NAD-dependent epimerase/dehydratase family protein n=1 Tax=Flammeovirga kamogawensis TaxID=373891 RepID=A0ABX8H4P0_9BACT|nr:NAD-dependent epimerase/dehydratase family protein [Flammeovirga kamogawensis]MBB6460336.1 nucleoside-diphosphate-sugar epimerase [Flammeovirga kamogawensis]QWG10145.1 NAD-dependent epimerase/dehydratase family protein [Flammeovirga kamogawensis]TRX65653.1 NAD-dependent epimerase/dehydratase family protein [Flammeovirga kamogawensis]